MLSAALLATSQAVAAGHCKTDEVTYFQCTIGSTGKVVALCGNELFDPATNERRASTWLQYRYGAPGKVELAFPQARAGSVEQFTGEYHHPYHGFYYGLSFNRKNVDYALVHVESETRFYGIEVTMGKRVVQMPCIGQPEVNLEHSPNDFFRLVQELSPR
ncbi:hypothetical protein DZC73_01300 [Albitalea terrae]|uniref:Uncharacterized protein n=1 Tax=Piscinibacter terrae TaxID=2496871 RepID=A0A3N7HTU0_9BURK|nr:hypothetical protein DZC73_01300 [Albitalea terrae]